MASTSTPASCDLPTAFVATVGSGPLTIAICAEYDALPGIGHACGHNVIAAAAVGAGLALAPLADDLGMTVKVIGTPAEEGGGGKILMLERGAFEGVDAAMMVHPAPTEMDRMACLAVSHVEVHYTGKEAHASAFPELGINAADAITIGQTRSVCCASTSGRPTGSTASSPTAATRPTSSPPTPHRSGTSAAARSRSWPSWSRACTSASRPARSAPGAPTTSS